MKHKGLLLAGGLILGGAATVAQGVHRQNHPLVEKHLSDNPEQRGLDDIAYRTQTDRSGQVILGLGLMLSGCLVGGFSPRSKKESEL